MSAGDEDPKGMDGITDVRAMLKRQKEMSRRGGRRLMTKKTRALHNAEAFTAIAKNPLVE